MQKISVPYGTSKMEALIDDSIPLQIIDVEDHAAEADLAAMTEDAMEHPIGSDKLENMVKPTDSVVIVVNDQTRPGPYEIMMHAIVERLERANVPVENVTVIYATGSHRCPTEEEQSHIIGAEYAARFRRVCHVCTDEANMVYLGETASGLPLYVNRVVAEADFLIVTGLIAPHHCAGYSGGRKSIVPGVAGIETLKKHHSFPIYQYDPAMGYMYGNPFHEAALEAAKKAGVNFMLNAVQDPHKHYIRMVAGDVELAHNAGADTCRDACGIDVEKPADLIICSPGGYPRDIDLYQSQKAISMAETVCTEKCTFILVAECRDGFGEGCFRQWMVEGESAQAIIERYAEVGFDVGTNKAFNYARALVHGRVIIVTDQLTRQELNEAKLDWAPDLQTAIDMAIAEKRPETISVIPYAVNFVAHVKQA